MNVLPFEKITYQSILSEEEILKRLHAKVDLVSVMTPFSFSNSKKPYQGSISGNSFTIRPIYRVDAWSFRMANSPILFIGKIQKNENGLKAIVVTIQYDSLTRLVLIFFGVFFVIKVISILIGFIRESALHFTSSVFVVVLTLLYFAYIYQFNQINNKSKKVFMETFDAQIVPD